MKRLGFAIAFGLGGYLLGAGLGYFLVQSFSGNRHDKEMEAAMTGAFFTGPLGAVLAAILGAVLAGRSKGK